jgi:uncharacterized protein
MLTSCRRLAGAVAGMALLVLLIGFAGRPTVAAAAAPTPAPSAGRAQPSAGGLTEAERAWLASVATTQGHIYTVFSGDTVELSLARMQAMEKSLGECRRVLRRIGRPTARLTPVFVLVDQACTQFDKAAKCFATAIKVSDASGTVEADPAGRVLDQAVTCGFAGYDDGISSLEAATAEGAWIGEQAATPAAAPTSPPPAVAYPDPAVCVDEVGVLGADTCARIRQVLQADERASTDEIAVVVVHSTGGVPIEAWGTGLFNAWGVGKRDTNNGVLLVVATDDRRLRIVTGRGLADRLSDGAASEIIGGTITPLFKDGRTRDGVLAGLDEIRRRLGHQVTDTNRLTDPKMAPIPLATDSQGGGSSSGWVGWLVVPGVFGVFGFVGFLILRGFVRGQGGGGDSGSSGSGSSFSSGSSGFSSGGSSFGGGSSAGGGASGSW